MTIKIITTVLFSLFISIGISAQTTREKMETKKVEEYDTMSYLGRDYMLGLLDGFKERSKEVYEKYLLKQDVPYGLSNRETFDHFHNPDFTKTPQAIFIFIHGGYWQKEVKESYAFMAKELLANNIDVILIEYDLTKESEKHGEKFSRVTMTAIVNELGTALDGIQKYLADESQNGKYANVPVYLGGHSAGGHLTATQKDHPLITGAVFPLSGLYDLVPISTTKGTGKALQLNKLEAVKLSPLYTTIDAVEGSLPIYVYYGADEQPELVNQSKMYFAKLKENGYDAQIMGIEGANHFTLLSKLFEDKDSPLLKTLLENIRSK